jgi:hypothetical protein
VVCRLKLKLFVLAASLTSLLACAVNPVVQPDPKPDPQPELGVSSEVSGQVSDWQQKGRAGVSRAVIKRLDPLAGHVLVVIAQGSIDAQGKLALKLSDAPADLFLQPYKVCGIDTAANAVEADIDVAEVGLETDGSKFFAFLGQEDDTGQVLRVYVDRKLEVDAACTEDGISAKLSLKKGWNLVLKSFTQPGRAGAVYSTASGAANVPFSIKLMF